jgi:ParB-like chromosome segregation protein Spo0J
MAFECDICGKESDAPIWHCDTCGFHFGDEFKTCQNCGQARVEYHEAANIFPLMFGAEFEELKADIKERGLIEAIWLYDGKIIDGRNRYRACVAEGVTPSFREWDGRGSLVSFVVSLNLKRRHLTSSQRAVIAEAALPLYEAEAKERQGTRTDLPTSVKKLPKVDTGKAASAAAKDFGTNRQYIADVKKIKNAAPAEVEKIKTGEKTISQIKKEINEKLSDVMRRKIDGQEKARKYFNGDKGSAELSFAGIASGLKMTLAEKHNIKISGHLLDLVDDNFIKLWDQTSSFVTMLIKAANKSRRSEKHQKKEAVSA